MEQPSLPLAQRSVFARLRQADTFTRSAALSQKAALKLPFFSTTPACENGVQKRPQAFLNPEI